MLFYRMRVRLRRKLKTGIARPEPCFQCRHLCEAWNALIDDPGVVVI